MAKVEIESGNGRSKVYLDGVDITNAIAHDGLRVDWSDGFPRVSITTVPLDVRVKLDDAVVALLEGLS